MARNRINADIEFNTLNANTLNISDLSPHNGNTSFHHVNNDYLYRDINVTHAPKNIFKIHQLVYKESSTVNDTKLVILNTIFQDIMILPNSILNITLDTPLRNDNTTTFSEGVTSTGWGGGYIELLYRINSGTYISLGNSGHSGVMIYGKSSILTYSRNFILEPSSAPTDAPYYFGMYLRAKSYDIDQFSTNPLYINGSHDINRTDSGGSTYQNVIGEPDEYLNNFYTSITILEYNLMDSNG
ncbi:hypothetical protein EB155_01465 [archaeon]|nr:hypothetical protein [archaeon]